MNDVAAQYVCEKLDPTGEILIPNEVRGRYGFISVYTSFHSLIPLNISLFRCIEHTMHLMASHFVAALGIPSLQKSRHHVHGTNIGDEYDEELDVETNTNIEVSEDDVEAVRAASITDFNPGDVVGKLMAFIAQLRMCGEDTRDYLKELAVANNCPSWEIKLWVRTRWGSLSDCFRTVLAIRKVKFSLRFQS